MNKQNLGYRLGKWYRKFRQWQHPTILKWLYVLIMGAVGVVFWDFVVCILMIAFVATRRQDNLESEKVAINHSDTDDEDDGLEVTPAGYYLDGFKLDDD